MAKNTDTSIKLLVLYDILCKMTDEDHALSTNEIINELAKRGIAVSRKVLPSDIALLNKYGYEVCSYTKKARYYYAVHQFFDTAEITMLADVVKASKLTESRKEAIICKLYSTIGVYRHPDPDTEKGRQSEYHLQYRRDRNGYQTKQANFVSVLSSGRK